MGGVRSKPRSAFSLDIRGDDSMYIDVLAFRKRAEPRRRAVVTKAVFVFCAVLAGAFAATPMAAQVQLPGVNLRDTNFEDGFAAPGLESNVEMGTREVVVTLLASAPSVRDADYTDISNNICGVKGFFERRTARTPRSCFDSVLVEQTHHR